MSDNQFIGRGETLTAKILCQLFPNSDIRIQVPIEQLIAKENYEFLDQEIKNHKFDIVVYDKKTIVIEVNYAHKEKAAKKWRRVFIPLLKEAGCIPVAINDWDCENLFKIGKHGHQYSDGDMVDVILSLKSHGVEI